MNTIEKMMGIIKEQFLTIMQDDPDYYRGFEIILSNEQQFIKNKDRKKENVYIIVKFLSGSLNYGQSLIPVNFNALGQGNKIEVCQRLLLEYAQTYNLGEEKTIADGNDNYIVKQIYNPPQVMSNFNETWNEFRTLFYMAGTFLVGKNSTPITDVIFFEDENDTVGTKMPFVTATWDLSIQLDSQAFYGTKSMTDSKSKIGTLTINLISYFTAEKMYKRIRAIAFRDSTNAPKGIKETFRLKIKFADGYETENPVEFHLAGANTVQNIGEFPLISMTFTN